MATDVKKPRIAAYGLFVPSCWSRVWRAFFDYRQQPVCTMFLVVEPGTMVFAYATPTVKKVVLDDLVKAVHRAKYNVHRVEWATAQKALEVGYDTETPYPVSLGDSAGFKVAQARPKRAKGGKRKAEGPGLFGR